MLPVADRSKRARVGGSALGVALLLADAALAVALHLFVSTACADREAPLVTWCILVVALQAFLAVFVVIVARNPSRHFVLGFVAQIVFGVKLGWFPISGYREGIQSLLLPALVLASLSLAYVARLSRTSVVENLRADYVRTARAKGLSTKRVIGIHTLRNSLIPVVTYLAVDLGALMGGAIITETIFNLPGIGRAVFDATRAQEGTVVIGIATFLVIVYMIANLLVDVLYGVLDPRIRYE